MKVFQTLAEALRQYYHVYERTSFGYRVRIKTARGFAFALVDIKPPMTEFELTNKLTPAREE